MRAFLEKHGRVIRWVSYGMMALALVVLVRVLPVGRGIEALREWIEGMGAWGGVVFGLAYALAVVALVPAALLTLAAGAVFGLGLGTLIVSVAATLGATLAFWIGRHFARQKVEKLAERHRGFGAIDAAIGREGWKMVGLLRLSPVLPFSVSNYLFGLTAVGLGPYIFATWIGALPGTVAYVYLGTLGAAGAGAGGEGGGTRSPLEWTLLGVGFLATVVVTVWLARIAKRSVQGEIGEDSREDADAASRDDLEDEQEEKPSMWKTLGIASAAFLAAALATACAVFPISFGPPAVKMKEAYAENPEGAVFDHSAFRDLLADHVDAQGWVDYGGLAEASGVLDGYLQRVAQADFDGLTRDEKLAFLLNAYNAFTLRLILDHLPLESIRDIPADQRWDGRGWTLAGRTVTLTELEHREIRGKFAEPRVHFAINCASVGCPPLRFEAYTGARLDQQLQEQALVVHGSPRWFRFDGKANRVKLTRIYDWYGGDFEQFADSITAYASRFAPLLAAARKDREIGVAWLPYDWSLNDVRQRSAATSRPSGEGGR